MCVNLSPLDFSGTIGPRILKFGTYIRYDKVLHKRMNWCLPGAYMTHWSLCQLGCQVIPLAYGICHGYTISNQSNPLGYV